MTSWKLLLLLTISCIFTQSFFAMMEMATVSFNKVRLQYYLSKKHRGGVLLNYLLQRPGLLFGTVLLGINISLLIGSECSRRFYELVGASPFWAPLTQAFLVLVFAEIAPIVAGRRYAEHVVMLGIAPLYVCAQALRPFIWVIDGICHWIHKCFDSSASGEMYLNREELQNIIEERKEQVSSQEKDSWNTVVTSIFSLKSKMAKELMIPLGSAQLLPATSSVGQLKNMLRENFVPYLPLFHKNKHHIVGVAYPRDLLHLPDGKIIKNYAKSPWFVTEDVTILQILKQFRKNNQNMAVVLGKTGFAVGILTLDKIVDEIFGQEDHWNSFGDAIVPVSLDRIFPGNTLLSDFKMHYQVDLQFKHAKTLSEAMELALGHVPRHGELVRIDQFELLVEEATLLGPKMISVRTI